jgi:hypothetical protein
MVKPKYFKMDKQTRFDNEIQNLLERQILIEKLINLERDRLIQMENAILRGLQTGYDEAIKTIMNKNI